MTPTPPEREGAGRLARELREAAMSGRGSSDHLYGLTPLPDELAARLLILAAQLEGAPR